MGDKSIRKEDKKKKKPKKDIIVPGVANPTTKKYE